MSLLMMAVEISAQTVALSLSNLHGMFPFVVAFFALMALSSLRTLIFSAYLFGPTDEVRSYGFALVRSSIRPLVSLFLRFHSNGALEFSDFSIKVAFYYS